MSYNVKPLDSVCLMYAIPSLPFFPFPSLSLPPSPPCLSSLPPSLPLLYQLPSSQVQQNPMRPQSKYLRQRPTNVPSFQFQPLAQRGVPVFYPQQATIMTDPNWYYNNMMLYQVTICHDVLTKFKLYLSYFRSLLSSSFRLLPRQHLMVR